MNEDKTATSVTSTSTTSELLVANMDETDWTAMLMEMRILSA